MENKVYIYIPSSKYDEHKLGYLQLKESVEKPILPKAENRTAYDGQMEAYDYFYKEWEKDQHLISQSRVKCSELWYYSFGDDETKEYTINKDFVIESGFAELIVEFEGQTIDEYLISDLEKENKELKYKVSELEGKIYKAKEGYSKITSLNNSQNTNTFESDFDAIQEIASQILKELNN